MNTLTKSFSFRVQLSLMMAVIVAITLIMITLFFFFVVNSDLEDRLLNQAKTDSKLLAYQFTKSVEERDDNLANRQVYSLDLIPSIQESAIFLANGSLLGFYFDIYPKVAQFWAP